MDPTNKDKDDLSSLFRHANTRRPLVRLCHQYFFLAYFGHYIQYAFAAYHEELFTLTQSLPPLSVILAFRNSAKSTIMTLSLPIWAIVGRLEKKFIIVVARTQEQARQFIRNIRDELERNELLRQDLGPFRMEEDEWRNLVLVLPKYGAKIMAVSVEQSVRGLRHGPHRPDLIVCDDLEDTQSVKTKDSRDGLYDFLKRDLLPAGSSSTQTVLVGNLLHEDSVLMRLIREIDAKKLRGTYKRFPLTDGYGNCLWPGKFPTQAHIEAEKQRIGNDLVWLQEYLLQIASSETRIVQPDWIQYYDTLPMFEPSMAAVGIDLAVSEKDSADFTAMVVGKAYYIDGKLRVYILPNPYHMRVPPLDALEAAKMLALGAKSDGDNATLIVEDVGYQKMFADTLTREGFYAEPVRPSGDKRARLSLVTPMMQSGKVFFPRTGCEELINELLNFGLERHDDLADAFAMLIAHFQQNDYEEPTTYLIRWDSGRLWRRPWMS